MAFRDSLKKYRESQASQPTATPSTVEKTEQTASGSTGSGGSFRDSLQKYRMAQTYTSSLEEWDKEIRGLLTYTQDRTSKWFDNAEYNSLYDRYNKLLAQADGWRKRYAGDEKVTSYIDSVVSSLETARKYSTDSYHYFSQWKNEEGYNAARQKQQEYYDKWGHYADEADFEEYSAKGAAIKNPNLEDVPGWLTIGSWNPFGEDPINKVTYTRDNWDKMMGPSGQRFMQGGTNQKAFQINDLYLEMTDDEVATYNYLLAKEGSETAQAFLDDIEESLNYRKGTGIAKTITGIDNDIERAFTEGIFSLGVGLDQFSGGVKQFVSGDELPTTFTQYANAQVADSIDGFGKYIYSAGTTLANMAPSILVGYINPIAGAATMGVSAAGNAYGQALKEGYSKVQARTYSTLVGAAEAALQYLLGGIGKLGGVSSGKILSKVAAIDNSLLRISAKLGVELGSEILEEEIQNYLEPAFRSIIFGEEYDAPTIDELIETAIVTAISTGVLEGGGTVSQDISDSRYYTNTYGNVQRELVDEALEIDPDYTYAQKLQSRLDAGKNLSGHQLGRVVQQNEATMTAQDKAAIQRAAESRLAELGETGDVSAIASAIVKRVAGENLSRSERQTISGSTYAQRVLNELNPKMIRSGKFSSSWAENIGTNRINVNEYSRLVEASQQPQEAADTTGGKVVPNVQKEEQAVQPGTVTAPAATVSADNKTYQISSGKEVIPQKIVSISKGKAIIQTDNGKIAAEDIAFGNTDMDLLWRSAVSFNGINPAGANGVIRAYKNNLPVATYLMGAAQEFKNGYHNFPSGGQYADKLTPFQRTIIYELGQKAAGENTAKDQSNVDTVYAEAKEILESGKKKKGSFHAVLEDNISPMQLNKAQKATYRLADETAQAVQTNIRVYAGKDKAQGFYNHTTDEIWLNLNAADTGREAVMAFTLAHEIVHRSKKGSPAKYKTFVNFLLKEYGKQGSDVDAMIAEQIAAAERFNKTVPDSKKVNMTREKALEEVACDACQRMFLDTNAGQKLAEFGAQSKQNKSFLEDLKRWIGELLDKLKRYFKDVEPDSLAAKEFAKFDANMKQILADMYVDMAIESGEKLSTIKAAYGAEFAQKFQGLKDISYNLAATETHKAKLQKEYSEDSSSDLQTIMARYDKIIDIWTRLGGELNSQFLADWNSKVSKDRSFTIFKAQAGYKYNVELSSMCKKGVPLFEAIDTIVKKEVMKELEIDVLGKAEKEILYDILKQHHFEIPCAICYVEQARQREGIIIDAFLNGKVETNAKGVTTKEKLGWNQVLESIEKEMKANGADYSFAQVSRDIATEKYTPANLDMDSKTQEAFYAALKKVANQEIVKYNKAEGKSRKLLSEVTPEAVKECFKGTLPANLKIFKVLFEEPSSRFKIQKDLLYSSVATQNLSMAHNKLYGLFNSQGGVSGYKTKQGTTIYWGDILGKTWKPDTLRNEGGVRNQSNSDFQMYTLLDQAQMYMDFTAKGYYLQAYTKVLSELKLFGLSRGKINASLIPKVVVYRNADGSVDIEKTMATAGLDENGNPIYDDIEGINHDEAFMLIEDPEYSKSICGICIGYSDAHINKLLDDNRVQQIIGFHDKTDDGTKRYKGARYAKNYNGLNEAVNKEGKTVHIGFNPYVKRAEKKFKFNAETETYESTVNYNGKTYTVDDIPRLATDLYLEMCAKKEYTPAYKDFAGHRNYYKLLADFGLYDSQGHYAPHRKVVYNMPDTVPYLDANGKKQTMKTYDYIKAELVKELTVRDSIAEALADTSDEGIIPQFKAAVKKAQEEKSFSLPKVFSDSIKRFGTTTDFEEAGFILPSGEMLKFTDDKHRGERQYDHRAIGMVYGIDVDLGVNHGFNKESGKFLDEFVENGGIRFDAGDPDLDMDVGLQLSSTVPITKAQEQLIRDLVKWKQNREELFEANLTEENFLHTGPLAIRIDFGGDSQYAVGAVSAKDLSAWGKKYLEYDGGNINADRIIADIRHYYQTGETRQPSLVSQFHYSYSLPKTDSDGNQLSEDQQEFFKDSKVRDANGNLLVVYHGTPNGNTTIFDKAKTSKINDMGQGIYFSTNKSDASTYMGKSRNKKLYSAYVNIKAPFVVSDDVKITVSEAASLLKLCDDRMMASDVYREIKINAKDGYITTSQLANTNISQSITEILEKSGKYDGIIDETVSAKFGLEKGTKHIITLSSNQIKSINNQNPTSDPDIRYSLPKGPYSYETLISKPDMVVTTVGGNVPNNRADVAHMAKKNATKVGKFDPKTGSVSVHVKDIDTDVILSTKGLRHGLRRTQDPLIEPNYIVTVKAGEILKNSIRINEITPEDENANSSYVLIGVARDANGTYVVRFVVNHFDNNVTAMDVLYAINAKKELAALNAPRLTAEPLSVTSSTISIEELLNLVNQYFPDILPEEVLKHYGYDSRPDGDLGEDALYKLPVGEDTSPRALLANAFEGIVTNDIEKRRLQEYKGKVEMLNAEEQKLRELRAEIKELSFAKGKRDTKRIKELQFEAMHTANRIATLDKMLLRLEAAAPLQSILKREKEMAYKRAEQKGKETLEAYRKAEKERDEQWRREVKDKYQASKKKAIETRDKREAREKLQKLVLDTVKWITYPSKTDVKCSDILKQPYADFLNSIDLSSQRLANGGDPTKNDLRLASAMSSLATALERVMVSQDPNQDATTVLDTGYLDLPANFVQILRDMTEDIKASMGTNEYVVNRMPADEIRKLTQMIRTLNHAIKEVSTLYANLRFANVEALGEDTMSFIDALGEIEKTGGIKDFVQWDNALPYYAFKRFGEGGESIFEGLMDAQDKLAHLAQQIFDFREKAWTDKEAKAWSEDTHTIDLPNGSTLTLTTADAMSIYCLSRRQQGLQHLLGGGTRVIGIQKGSQKSKDSRSLLTIKDIDSIISSLTDRQKQVADTIQEFMSSVCSGWGNEISMKRFLTKEFNERFYFPIESNDENLSTKDPSAQQSDLFRLLNISATKPIDPRANNEVIIRNVFDVFTNHAADMARLNAYGMALLDYMKWLNYREKTVNEEGQINVRGVRKSMEKAFGTAARSYVLNLVKDVNGRPSDGGLPSFYTRMLRNAKTAMVGSSLRVATLQITSYPRAAMVLSPKNLALGLTKMPQIKKAKKYCGIALWKSFGFYDTNIARSIEDQIKGVKNIKQKLIELSLKGAEIGDAITWGALWNACEYEVAATKKYKVGTDEFYQEVGKKLREVVYRTQVVDSTLTRSEMMRSKNAKAQELSAFMSEPTLSANIIMDAGFEFNMEKRRTGSIKAAWHKTGKYVTRAVAVYSIGQLAAALLEGLWDAWRDDDDEEFGEKFLKAFGENLLLDLLPFNKIPIISDLAEAALSLVGVGYFSADSLSSTALSQTVSAVKAWTDVLNDSSSDTPYNALYKSMRAISSWLGVSISGVMREGVALWNNTAGAYDITWKIRTWDLSKSDLAVEALEAIIEGNDRQASNIREEFPDEDSYQSEMRTAIKDRYTAGEIDYNTAIRYLIKYGGVEEDDAYWKAEEWKYESETGEDFGKYDEFFTAVETGKNLKAVIKKYTDNGVKVETLATQITNHYKPLYIEMSTSEKAGIKGYLLNAYEQCGVAREDATKKLQYWEFLSEQPDSDLTQYQVADYYKFAKPAGISAGVYTEYCNKVEGIEGDGKKERRMAVIHSMPLSAAQKDALYYAEGWAASRIYEAPWH